MYMVQSAGYGVQGTGYRVQGTRYRVEGTGYMADMKAKLQLQSHGTGTSRWPT